TIRIAVTIKITLNDIEFAATNPIIKGSKNCAKAIVNLVNIFAIVPKLANISIQEGVTQVSKNEFAAPPIIANIYAI
ncbi:hypothetical protein, partial [Enterobacter quasiroggenkampii]|uniref:hypothetical protein n=1 Tax=Enterobacter quasiroggenkampii TaxID=2497436 RepID=UPI0021CE08E1